MRSASAFAVRAQNFASPEPPIVFLISPVSSRVTLPNGESGDLACDDTAAFQLRRHELLSDQTDRIRELQQPV